MWYSGVYCFGMKVVSYVKLYQLTLVWAKDLVILPVNGSYLLDHNYEDTDRFKMK